MMDAGQDKLLEVRNLNVRFRQDGALTHAVKDVSSLHQLHHDVVVVVFFEKVHHFDKIRMRQLFEDGNFAVDLVQRLGPIDVGWDRNKFQRDVAILFDLPSMEHFLAPRGSKAFYD